jgi:hypothetical protein
MDRKHFLGTAAALAAGSTLPLSRSIAAPSGEPVVYKKPPYLKRGDLIGSPPRQDLLKLKKFSQPLLSCKAGAMRLRQEIR